MPDLPIATPAAIGLCPARSQRLLDVLQANIDRQHLPGAVVLIARRGQIGVFEALGRQNPATGTAMARDSIFRIYSMTKPLVSVAAMMLVEQGRILLSDPVSQYLPEFAHQRVAVVRNGEEMLTDAVRPATVHDLLRHTAGLTYEFLGEETVQKRYARDQLALRTRSNAEFCETLAALPLMFQPGSTWAYSRATDVLGRLVEVVGGQTLGIYLQQHIFAPLGMVDTGFSVPSEQHLRIAEPFDHDPDGGERMPVIEPREAPALESGGGGLMSTAMEYARFLQFMLNKGELDGMRLLGPRTVDYMTADHLGLVPSHGDLLLPGHGFGLGFAVRLATGMAPVPGSAGMYYWTGIAGTSFFVDPAQDLYAIMLAQAPNQRHYYRQLFRNLVYAAVLD